MDFEISQGKLEDGMKIIGGGISLELGDIVRIDAPTNDELNEQTFYIIYIDTDIPETTSISIVNIANFDKKELRIVNDKYLSDESITNISLLARNPVKGYARQHNLVPNTWIDIRFGGEFPMVITGQITNLEDDMIEITTYPEVSVIYIDFGYRGIPLDLPIEKISIRDKPASIPIGQEDIQSEYITDDVMNEPDIIEPSISYTESGESIISIPDSAKPNENIEETLSNLYLDGDDIFGETLGDVVLEVEVPESQKRYGIETQMDSLMDGLLADIPMHKRTNEVLENVHRLVERFKELRQMYSKFDDNGNVQDIKINGKNHIPLHNPLFELRKIPWIIPVVKNTKNVYSEEVIENVDAPDVINFNITESLNEQYDIQKNYYNTEINGDELKYEKLQREMNIVMKPYNRVLEENNNTLVEKNVEEDIDLIVKNFGDYGSTARKTLEKKDFQDNIKKFSLLRHKTYETRPYRVEIENGAKVFIPKKVTTADKADIQSILMLPKPAVFYTKAFMPGTNMLMRTNIGRTCLEHYLFLNKNTNVNVHEIVDINEKFQYEVLNKKTDSDKDENLPKFLDNIMEFNVSNDVPKNAYLYSDTLYNVLPEMQTCIDYMEQYMTDKLSISDAVKLLEPFHIYVEDITYSQYTQIISFITRKRVEYNEKLKNRSDEYSKVIHKLKQDTNIVNVARSIFSEKKQYLDLLIELYFLNDTKVNNMTSSELLFYMEKMDGSSLLYSIISRALMSLYTPDALLNTLEFPKIDDMSEIDKIRPKDCVRRFLTKKYHSISDLQKDNNKEIFYDKEMDDTPYSIFKKYEKQKGKMTAETFVDFLAENLIQKHDCNTNLAKELAKTLISGKKMVVDGEYAILEVPVENPEGIEINTLTMEELTQMRLDGKLTVKTHYYVRKNNNWVRDDSISEEAFMDTQTLFCNIQDKCYKNTTNNQCDTMERARLGISHSSNERILSEIGKRLNMSVEEMEKSVENAINKYKKSIYSNTILRELDLYRQNTTALNLANNVSESDTSLKSPHLKTLDMILSLNDFVRQQKDIVWFYNEYCRTPLTSEDQAWMYCKETNTKLLPYFMYSLAIEFMEGGDYQYLLDRLCANAELSDDGDYYVDKATGFPLKKRDFVDEDEFDDAGFKITTHSILEKDLATIISETLSKKVRVFDNENDQMVYNVFMAIVNTAGLPHEHIEEFVLRVSFELIRNPAVIMEEEKYKQRAAKLEKDTGKTSIVFPIYKNQAIMSIIAGVILIAVQCVIPSIKTRKTFPGCVKSFSGYPLSGGIEDVSGLKYIACLINGIKYDEEPWKSVMKLSPAVIATRIRDVLEKHILKRNDVTDLYNKKREYLLLHPEDVIPTEHSIEKWRGFLPPVVDFSVISKLHNVSSDFKSHLLETLKKGHKDQFVQLGIVSSRTSSHTYGIIELIYNIVKDKTSILTTSGGVPFLENACCNERNHSTHPLTYFETVNPIIRQYNTITNEFHRISEEIRLITKAGILYHEPPTAIIRVDIPTTETEKVLYETIIHYAKYDRNLPVPENLVNVCGEKPAGYKQNWHIDEKIEYLKKHGKRYDQNTLKQVMEQVRLQNLVHIPPGEPFNQVVKLMGFLETMDLQNSEVVPAPLRELLIRAIRAYRPKEMKKDGTVKEIIQLRKYLAKSNEQMLKEIINVNRGSFIKSYGNITTQELRNLQDFMANIHVWKMDIPDAGYNGIYTVSQFIKTSVESLTKIYPNMIMHNASYNKVNKHWDVSGFHSSDITKILTAYLNELNQFKGDETLYRFLQEVQKKTLDIHLLLQHIPMETPIEKDGNTYFELFDKKTLYYLHVYCWYSVFYEYMNMASDTDLLNIDIQEQKRARRVQNIENSNPSDNLTTIFSTTLEEVEEGQSELYEVEIRAGEKEDLQKRVCSLMIACLHIDQQNKKTLDKSYSEIAKRVRRSKEEEKKAITDYLKNMQKDERKVEDLLKQLHQGRWNAGIQKGVFIYDKTTYDTERNAAILRFNQDLVTDDSVDVEQMEVGVDELEQQQNNENDEFYDMEATDIQHFGDDYMDGNYYGDEGDDDFAYDD